MSLSSLAKNKLWLSFAVALGATSVGLFACSVESKDDYNLISDSDFEKYKDSGLLPGQDGGAMMGSDCSAGQFQCDDAGSVIGCTNGYWNTEPTVECGSAALCNAAVGACRVCVAGEFQCNEEMLEQCNIDGSAYELSLTCADAESCVVGTNKQVGYCLVCEPGDAVCDPKVLGTFGEDGPGSFQPAVELRACNDDGNGTTLTEACSGSKPFCNVRADACTVCKPDDVYCLDGELITCDADGAGAASSEDCGLQALCNAADGVCETGDCAQGEAECEAGTAALRACGPDGKWVQLDDCLSAATCSPDLRRCTDCAPGAFRCDGNNLIGCSNNETSQWYPPAGTEYVRYANCNGCTDGNSQCNTQYAVIPYNYCSYGGYGGPTCYYQPGYNYQYVCTQQGNYIDYYGPGTQCPAGEGCIDATTGECGVCHKNSTWCESVNTDGVVTIQLKSCNADGTEATLIEDCGVAADGAVCNPALGKCLPALPGDQFCDADGNYSKVNLDGSVTLVETCGGPELCDKDRGCLHALCVPGAVTCDGASVLDCTDGLSTDAKGVQCDSAARCSPGIGCNQAIALGAGELHSCAILSDSKGVDGEAGFLMCWGANDQGQLGNGSSILGDSIEPRHVVWYPGGDTSNPPLSPPAFTSVCGGRDFSCATLVTQDGPRVACWGSNAKGQLGINSTEKGPFNYAGAFVTNGVEEFAGVAVACGSDFACALNDVGEIGCWGANDHGQVATTISDAPVLSINKQVGRTFASIAAGAHHACAVDPDGKVFCWGANASGQLGLDSATDVAELTEVPTAVALATATAALGRDFSLFVADGADNPWAFGANGYGQLATGDALNSQVAIAAATLTNEEIEALFSGTSAAHACAKIGNTLSCWGANAYGQLGNESTDNSPTPVAALDGLTNATKVRAGAHSAAVGVGHTCAITLDGNVLCWGANHRGQLGSDALSPVTSHVQAL